MQGLGCHITCISCVLLVNVRTYQCLLIYQLLRLPPAASLLSKDVVLQSILTQNGLNKVQTIYTVLSKV